VEKATLTVIGLLDQFKENTDNDIKLLGDADKALDETLGDYKSL
jgi:hypothetical protein